MNPGTRFILAALLLAVAFGFYFFGEGLLDTAEAPIDPEPTPAGFLPLTLLNLLVI